MSDEVKAEEPEAKVGLALLTLLSLVNDVESALFSTKAADLSGEDLTRIEGFLRKVTERFEAHESTDEGQRLGAERLRALMDGMAALQALRAALLRYRVIAAKITLYQSEQRAAGVTP